MNVHAAKMEWSGTNTVKKEHSWSNGWSAIISYAGIFIDSLRLSIKNHPMMRQKQDGEFSALCRHLYWQLAVRGLVGET